MSYGAFRIHFFCDDCFKSIRPSQVGRYENHNGRSCCFCRVRTATERGRTDHSRHACPPGHISREKFEEIFERAAAAAKKAYEPSLLQQLIGKGE